MNTETGRVYLEEEFDDRKHRRILDEHQAEFEKAFTEGKIVPVSDRVAVQQLLGQEYEIRKARRKAQKQARKRNRH